MMPFYFSRLYTEKPQLLQYLTHCFVVTTFFLVTGNSSNPKLCSQKEKSSIHCIIICYLSKCMVVLLSIELQSNFHHYGNFPCKQK